MLSQISQLKALRELAKSNKLKFIQDELLLELNLSDSVLDLLSKNRIEFTLRINNENVRKNFYTRHIGQEVSISIDKFELGIGNNIYESWDDFLDTKANLFRCPDLFWITSNNFLFNKEDKGVIDKESVITDKKGKATKHNKPTNDEFIFNNYLNACSLIELLIEVSDYQEILNDEVFDCLIFLSKSKLEISPEYGMIELEKGLDGITIVLSMFKEAIHTEHKKSMFKEVLHSLLFSVPVHNRFAYLFTNFGDFSSHLLGNYRLFVSEFSFDSVRSEYEEKKRDYIVKLNDVLASVQTKMLGIPISLAFLSLKYDGSSFKDDVFNNVITNNITLSIGIMIYCIMMFLLIMNQFHTLSAVKEEYTSLMMRLKYNQLIEDFSIQNPVSILDKRYKFQWRALAFFNFITICLFFSITLIIMDSTLNLDLLNNSIIEMKSCFSVVKESFKSFINSF